jgi:hypothetical protein
VVSLHLAGPRIWGWRARLGGVTVEVVVSHRRAQTLVVRELLYAQPQVRREAHVLETPSCSLRDQQAR